MRECGWMFSRSFARFSVRNSRTLQCVRGRTAQFHCNSCVFVFLSFQCHIVIRLVITSSMLPHCFSFGSSAWTLNTEHQHNKADSFCLQHHFQLHLKLTAISDGDDAVVDDSQYEFRFSISKERITKWTNERKHVKKQPVARRCVCASWQVRQKRKINDWAQEIMIMC